MATDRRDTRTVAGTRPRLGTGLSTNEDGQVAARAALDAALAPLGGDAADLVLLFISPQHEDVQRAIIDIATERVGGATVCPISSMVSSTTVTILRMIAPIIRLAPDQTCIVPCMALS